MNKQIKNIMNCYGGVGGNRELWQNVNVTTIELDETIAAIYAERFPQDTVIVGDAHKYLLEHYIEFDFIWSSPPCQTHSKTMHFNHIKKRYPDMKLYEEILFLKHFATAFWVVENVQPYYKPLISGQEIGRHLFWSNFPINGNIKSEKVRNDKIYFMPYFSSFLRNSSTPSGVRLKNRTGVIRT